MGSEDREPKTEEPEEEEKPMLSIGPAESIYDFVLFVPALPSGFGAKSGWDLKLGFILLVINFTMQVGLTWVVGQGVLEDGSAWRTELVSLDEFDQMEVIHKEDSSAVVAFLDHPIDDVEDFVSPWEDERLHHHSSFLQRHLGFHAWSRKPKGGKGGAAASDHGGGGSSAPAGAKTFCSFSKKNATYTCLPPSVRFAQYWDRLDTNGDGVWTMEEAEKDKGGLQKKINVKPFALFRAITIGLMDRKDAALYIPQEMKDLKAMPKAYFDYWAGDAALCAHADVGLCSSLASKGIFNKALDPNLPGKDIQDLDSAMDYCAFMLKPGGGCDQSLPQIYKLYKARRAEQCGDMSFYAAGLYKNPYNDKDKMYVIGASYGALDGFEKSTETTFKCFLFLVLLLWFYALLEEMRQLLMLAEFCLTFPTVESAEAGATIEEDGDNAKVALHGITKQHRMIISIMTFLRILLIIYIGSVGVVFLVNDTGYMDLLMNAVALVFIIEIDELLFGAMARVRTMDMLSDNIDGFEFPTSLPTEGCAGWMLTKDFWGLVVFPIIAIAVILCHLHFTVDAVLDALNCACYQTGDQCKDMHYYSQDWWDGYWTETLPKALQDIAALKASGK